MVQMLNNIKDQMYRYRVEYLKDAASHELLVDEHKKLCCHLENRDADAAADLMHLHIQRQEEYILKTLTNA